MNTDAAGRIGIRLSIYDSTDNELWHSAAWLPWSDDMDTHRGAFDACSAALWDAVGVLVRQHTVLRLAAASPPLDDPATHLQVDTAHTPTPVAK